MVEMSPIDILKSASNKTTTLSFDNQEFLAFYFPLETQNLIIGQNLSNQIIFRYTHLKTIYRNINNFASGKQHDCFPIETIHMKDSKIERKKIFFVGKTF